MSIGAIIRGRNKVYLLGLLLMMTTIRSFSQSCNCPPIAECAPCQNGLTSLTLRYNGGLLPALITAEDGQGIVFSGIVAPAGIFSFSGSVPNEKFVGDIVTLRVTGLINTTINTSCNVPVYARSDYGSFTIIAGESVNGSAICCSPDDVETIPPVISNCPIDIIATANATECSAIVTWTQPTASDNCAISTFTSTHIPGDIFPIGITEVTYTATDDYGNSSNCIFYVEVRDVTEPVFTSCISSSITAYANNSCQAVVSWAPPIASDLCGGVTLTSTRNPGDTFPLGITHVIYTATDDSGNSTTCEFDVIVNDTSAPAITGCPSSDVIASANALCQASVSWPTISAADNCSATTLTRSHNPGDIFPLGTTVVTYTARDIYNNTSTCVFNVVVIDDTNPVIAGCPSNIVVSANAACQANASWTLPTASDNCGIVTLTSSHNPGAVFQLGTTQVTYTAKDPAGNTSYCTFNVVVIDDTNPVITGCPSNIMVSANATCQANVSWTPPAASDNCGTATLTSTHSPGSIFPLGTTSVIYTATDGSNNKTTCTFNVVVADNTNPVIAGCPSDITVTANGSCLASVSWTAPTATDNCGAVTLTSSHTPGTFALGTTQVIYTATDGAGNKSTCTFNVIVKDQTAPVISGCVNTDIIVTANASCQAVVSWAAPTATDNCGSVTLTKSHNPGDTFSLGTTIVTYRATDGSGNISTCTFNVVVKDETAPVISGCISSDIIVPANSSCQANVNWTPPTATDNCGTVTLTSSHNPGAVFQLGTTQVTYTATDGSGKSSICRFNVIVRDETSPVITGCIASDIIAPANSSCKANVSWTPPTATDNCGTVTLTSSRNPGDSFQLGTTQVTYTATDGAGNISICTFNVIVRDETVPVISGCPQDITVTANASSCQASVVWVPPTASDNCMPVTLTRSHSPGVFPIGTTQVTYTATDPSGNSSICSFNVIVKDATPPVISGCPASDILANANNSCQANVSWAPPTATDNCGTVTLTSSHTPGSAFPLGTTQVTYTATDGSGNTSLCRFNVIVRDVSAPVISGCISSDIIVNASTLCQASVSWIAPTATDNCGPVTMTSSHNPGSTFPIGTTQVSYTAQDGAGNTAVCRFNVVVKDGSAPIIASCPASIIVEAEASCKSTVRWTPPVASDCGTVTLTSSHNPGDIFSFGTTEVTYTATDNVGNSSTCKFTVTVQDKTVPVFIQCPNDITVKAGASCNATASWVLPTASDHCGIASVTSSHAPGNVFPIGITEVKYTATDNHGNVSFCQFKIIVSNESLPVISGCPGDIAVKANESGEVHVDWTSPIASVQCGTVLLTSSHNPGDPFSVGNTQVEYKATDLAGNSAVCRFTVTVSYEDLKFSVNQAITPDGDGINDEWLLPNIEKFKDNRVVIVDRWGSVVFSATGYNNENVVWKGLNKSGVMVPAGTYFYTISVRFNNEVSEKKGFIELVR